MSTPQTGLRPGDTLIVRDGDLCIGIDMGSSLSESVMVVVRRLKDEHFEILDVVKEPRIIEEWLSRIRKKMSNGS